jgi:hypothetical protein
MSTQASQTITVHVPVQFAMRGGRKAILTEASPPPSPAQTTQDALLKALAKAFRWRKQIENGEFATVAELAREMRVNKSYACRILRLSLLCPEIVTAILDRRQSPNLTLNRLGKPMPIRWEHQIALLELV